MYIQPYEPQDYGFGTTSLDGYPAPQATLMEGTESDRIAPVASWTRGIPGITDAAGALEDAPFGQFGLGAMLQNLTGMMQQILQMMQALLGRTGNGEGGGLFGHLPPSRISGGEPCGCTQPPDDRRYPLENP